MRLALTDCPGPRPSSMLSKSSTTSANCVFKEPEHHNHVAKQPRLRSLRLSIGNCATQSGPAFLICSVMNGNAFTISTPHSDRFFSRIIPARSKKETPLRSITARAAFFSSAAQVFSKHSTHLPLTFPSRCRAMSSSVASVIVILSTRVPGTHNCRWCATREGRRSFKWFVEREATYGRARFQRAQARRETWWFGWKRFVGTTTRGRRYVSAPTSGFDDAAYWDANPESWPPRAAPQRRRLSGSRRR
jgi:hypothetical protein